MDDFIKELTFELEAAGVDAPSCCDYIVEIIQEGDRQSLVEFFGEILGDVTRSSTFVHTIFEKYNCYRSSNKNEDVGVKCDEKVEITNKNNSVLDVEEFDFSLIENVLDETEDTTAANELDLGDDDWVELTEKLGEKLGSIGIKESFSAEAQFVSLMKSQGDVSMAIKLLEEAHNLVVKCKPCRHMLQGRCMRSDCYFEHELHKYPCRYWLHSQCFMASSVQNNLLHNTNSATSQANGFCPFMHDIPDNDEQRNIHDNNRHNDFTFTDSSNKNNSSGQKEVIDEFPSLVPSSSSSIKSNKNTNSAYSSPQPSNQPNTVESDTTAVNNVINNNSTKKKNNNKANKMSLNDLHMFSFASKASPAVISNTNTLSTNSYASMASKQQSQPTNQNSTSTNSSSMIDNGSKLLQRNKLISRSQIDYLSTLDQQSSHTILNPATRGAGGGKIVLPADWVEDTGKTLSEDYSFYRNQAREYALMRNKLLQEATIAFTHGGRGAAKALSTQGQELNLKMKECHQQAAKSIFQKRNTHHSVMNQGKIDIHGLHVAEAQECIYSILPILLKKSELRIITIITGTGHHTLGPQQGKSRLIPAVTTICEEMNLKIRTIKDNNGFVGAIQIISVVCSVKQRGLPIEGHEIDHICYRCKSNNEYIEVRDLLSSTGVGGLLLESMIGGRPISVVLLENAITYDEWNIRCIEIASPKSGRNHQNGFEHIEIVVDNSKTHGHIDSRCFLEDFASKFPSIEFDRKAINKHINADICIFVENGYSVKYHARPLYEVCIFEKETGHVEQVPSDYFNKEP